MKKFLPVLPAVLLCSCRSLENARTAQAEADRAASSGVAGERVDLSRETLAGLVDFAVSNRPSMKAAALALKDARLQLVQIAADAPLVSATPWNAAHASVSVGYSESSKPVHAEDFKFKTRRSDPSATLSLDLLVWDFGRNDARLRAQAENTVAAEYALWREGFSVFAETCAAWFAFNQSEALLEVARTNVAQYAEHLEQAEARFEQGEARKLDVLRAKLDLATAREASVAASNDVAVAGARLMAALGLDASRGDFRSAFGERGGALGRMERAFAETRATAAEEFAFARTNAPAMAIARANLKAASAQVDYAVADFLPTISVGVSFNWTDPLWYWRWGLDAVQTLFTGGRKTAALDRAVVALESASSALEAASQQLSRDIEIAVAERDSAREGLAAAETSVLQARENLDNVAAEYRFGDASRVDFADAVSAYAAALGNRVKAFYRGQAAEAALFEITGRMPVFAAGAQEGE